MKKPELYEFRSIRDVRGNLSFLEGSNDIPFEVKRVYWITDAPEQQVRGGHAHKTSSQLIVCQQGVVDVVLENRRGDLFNFTLDEPHKGLLIPPMWWGKMLFGARAILLGLASDEFSEEDYVRDKKEFMKDV